MACGSGNLQFTVKQAFLAREKAGCREPGFYYRFAPDIPGDDNAGTFHSCDLWFFFETLAKCTRPFTGRHYDLARQMCDYFARFVIAQDPNGVGTDRKQLPAWSPYTETQRAQMIFTGDGAKEVPEEQAHS